MRGRAHRAAGRRLAGGRPGHPGLDGGPGRGDPRTAADVRDRVSLLPAPFTSAPTELAALALRFGVHWGDGDLALVDEWWWQTRRRAPGGSPRPARRTNGASSSTARSRTATPIRGRAAGAPRRDVRPAHLAGREEPVPLRRRRLTRGRPPLPGSPRPRIRAERAPVALRAPTTSTPSTSSIPGRAGCSPGARRAERPTTTFAGSTRTALPARPARPARPRRSR